MLKAQIALEEAQNNKNSMKLVRNEQGNWIYQYVADIEELKTKEQDYLNKINEWSNASVDAVNDIEQNILDSYEEFTSRVNQNMEI